MKIKIFKILLLALASLFFETQLDIYIFLQLSKQKEDPMPLKL
jgi:hypothetical protein